MILRCCIVLATILLSSSAWSQSTDWVIEPQRIDLVYLRSLVKNGIDSTRKIHNLPSLQTDKILQQKSEQLAISFISQDKFIPAKLNLPSKNKYSINAVKTVVHEPVPDYGGYVVGFYHLNTTYKQTASEIVKTLLNSKTYSKKILSASFSYSGLAIKVNEELNTLNIVQVITQDAVSSEVAEDKVPKPVTELKVILPKYKTTYEFSLKGPKLDRNQLIVNRFLSKTKDGPSGGNVYASFKIGKRVFRWWQFRTGLMYEKRNIDTYASEEKFHAAQSRYNQRSILNAHVSDFKRAHEIVREAREFYHFVHNDKIKIFGWKTPLYKAPKTFMYDADSDKPDSAVRIVLVRKGELCGVITIQPIPGQFIRPHYPVIPFTSLGNKPFETNKAVLKNDTVTATVNYKRGSIHPDNDQLSQLVREIPIDRKITHIHMKAFASVEGNESMNNKLFSERAEELKRLLGEEGLITDSATMNVVTQENWDMFYKQLDGSELDSIKNYTRDALRKYVNKHSKDTLMDEWLYEQRYGEVVLSLQHTDTIPVSSDTLANRFNNQLEKMFADNKAGNLSSQQLDILERLQLAYYNRIMDVGAIDKWQALKISTPEKPLVSLEFNQMVYKLNYGLVQDSTFFNWLHQKRFQKRLDGSMLNQFKFNSKVYVANHYFLNRNLENTKYYLFHRYRRFYLDFIRSKKELASGKEDPEEDEVLVFLNSTIPDILKTFKTFRNDSMHRALRLFYIIDYLNIKWPLGAKEKDGKINAMLNELWNSYVKNKALSDGDRIEWALFFNLYYRFDWSVELLTPIAERQKPDHFALQILISIKACRQQNKDMEERIIKAADVLTNEEWCGMLTSGTFLPVSFLENYNIRRLYQKKVALLSGND